YDCTAFVGGIMRNFESNFVWGQNKVMVVEADEYDRSFLQLHPDVAIITATDADHLDIYDTHEGVKAGFNTFASQVKEKLILQKRTEIVGQTADKIITYALQAEQKQVTSTIQNLEVLDGAYRFDWQSPQGLVKNCTLNVGGKHNIENAIAAMTIAQYLGIETEAIKVALAAFKGIKRRFEYVVKRTDLVIIDDYAHHPEEVRVLLESVRELYPSKKITAVFQPHLYTRTRDFATGFAETLSLADEVVVLDIYPARELPIKGIDAELILRQMNLEQKYNFNLTNVISWLREKKLEILVLIGAGSIGTLAPKLKEIY
ncbi:MAG: UDP-N-acetylmuramate--L-alanine ligase, partial [Chitinophagales bacterium]